MGIVAKDYYELAMTVYTSKNFIIVKDRVSSTPWTTYVKRAFKSYGDVATLYYDEQFEDAGEAFAKGMFPKRYRNNSNIDWETAAPYNEYENDISSGVLAGMIYSMLGEKNFDNLTKCIHPANVLDTHFGSTKRLGKKESIKTRGAVDHIVLRYNEDMWSAMVKMHSGF